MPSVTAELPQHSSKVMILKCVLLYSLVNQSQSQLYQGHTSRGMGNCQWRRTVQEAVGLGCSLEKRLMLPCSGGMSAVTRCLLVLCLVVVLRNIESKLKYWVRRQMKQVIGIRRRWHYTTKQLSLLVIKLINLFMTHAILVQHISLIFSTVHYWNFT